MSVSMPPAKKRARSYDPAKIRTAVLAQFENVRQAVGTLTPEQLALPTRLGDWTVRELAAHIAMVVGAVGRNLELPEPRRSRNSRCWTGRSRPSPPPGRSPRTPRRSRRRRARRAVCAYRRAARRVAARRVRRTGCCRPASARCGSATSWSPAPSNSSSTPTT